MPINIHYLWTLHNIQSRSEHARLLKNPITLHNDVLYKLLLHINVLYKTNKLLCNITVKHQPGLGAGLVCCRVNGKITLV